MGSNSIILFKTFCQCCLSTADLNSHLYIRLPLILNCILLTSNIHFWGHTIIPGNTGCMGDLLRTHQNEIKSKYIIECCSYVCTISWCCLLCMACDGRNFLLRLINIWHCIMKPFSFTPSPAPQPNLIHFPLRCSNTFDHSWESRKLCHTHTATKIPVTASLSQKVWIVIPSLNHIRYDILQRNSFILTVACSSRQ